MARADPPAGLYREALLGGLAALLLAPFVALGLDRPAPPREDLAVVRSTLDAAQWSGGDLLFFLTHRAEPLRYPPRLGNAELVRQAMNGIAKPLTFLADARRTTWDIRADDSEVFLAYRDLARRADWQAAMGRALALVLIGAGTALVILARRLRQPLAPPTDPAP